MREEEDTDPWPPLISSSIIIIAVCSADHGRSWSRRGQILTVGTRPATPAWAGIGDFDVVWDWQQRRHGRHLDIYLCRYLDV